MTSTYAEYLGSFPIHILLSSSGANLRAFWVFRESGQLPREGADQGPVLERGKYRIQSRLCKLKPFERCKSFHASDIL